MSQHGSSQNQNWAVPPWMANFGYAPQSTTNSMMDEMERRMNDFERRFERWGNGEEFEGYQRGSLVPHRDDDSGNHLQVEESESGWSHPISMLKDYLGWSSESGDKLMSTPSYEWNVKDDGNLELKMRLPSWMEAKDVQLDVENGTLYLSAKKSHNQSHKSRDLGQTSQAYYSMTLQHEWPLDPSVTDKNVHANFDKSEGVLEVTIDVPQDSSLQKYLKGDRKNYEGEEDNSTSDINSWVGIPISSRRRGSGSDRDSLRYSMDDAEQEGMLKYAKQATESAADSATSTMQEMGSKAKDMLKGATDTSTMQEMGSKAKDMLKGAKDKAGEAYESIKDAASDTMDSAKEKVTEAVSSATKSTKSKDYKDSKDSKDAKDAKDEMRYPDYWGKASANTKNKSGSQAPSIDEL